MGIETDEIDYGDDCSCFEAGKTPLYMFASFQNIILCPGPYPLNFPAPPNLIWSMQQVPGTPCVWDGVHGDLEFLYVAKDGFGHSSLVAVANVLPFPQATYFGAEAANCGTYFENLLGPGDCGEAFIGHGGIASVWWVPDAPAPSINTVQDLLGMEHASENKADFYPVNADQTIVKLCRKRDKTNILIRYEP